jgi:hypothetical protein
MRSCTIALAFSLLFGVAHAASAQDDEEAASSASAEQAEPEPEPEEEAEPGFFARYGSHVGNTFLGGANGILTWPADPVMLAVRPTDEMRDMPGGIVTGHVVGFFAGTLQGVYRLVNGVLDVALCPFSFFPMFSPEPRYQLIPGWEHAG